MIENKLGCLTGKQLLEGFTSGFMDPRNDTVRETYVRYVPKGEDCSYLYDGLRPTFLCPYAMAAFVNK